MLFSRINLKVSFSCGTSIKGQITASKRRKMTATSTPASGCYCTANTTFPVDRRCREKALVYNFTVKELDGLERERTYNGLTKNSFEHL